MSLNNNIYGVINQFCNEFLEQQSSQHPMASAFMWNLKESNV